MTNVAVQTDDILINGIPLSEYIVNSDDKGIQSSDNYSDDDRSDCNDGDIEQCILAHLLFSDNEIDELRESVL